VLVTREADYAFRCVLEVAKSGRVSAAEVARRQDISLTFLGKIVQSLARASILSTRRGVGGGMTLARPADSITLLQVIEAVEGPLCINSCLTDPPQCERIDTCPAYPYLSRAQDSLRKVLSSTIGELLGPSSPAEADDAGSLSVARAPFGSTPDWDGPVRRGKGAKR